MLGPDNNPNHNGRTIMGIEPMTLGLLDPRSNQLWMGSGGTTQPTCVSPAGMGQSYVETKFIAISIYLS